MNLIPTIIGAIILLILVFAILDIRVEIRKLNKEFDSFYRWIYELKKSPGQERGNDLDKT